MDAPDLVRNFTKAYVEALICATLDDRYYSIYFDSKLATFESYPVAANELAEDIPILLSKESAAKIISKHGFSVEAVVSDSKEFSRYMLTEPQAQKTCAELTKFIIENDDR